MEALLSRFRNLTVLLFAVVAQLLYLGYQVKTQRDERLIRVWAVTAVTPMAGVVEAVRHNTIGFLEDYFILLDVREQNRKLKATNDRLQMENIYYRNQLSTAEHAQALIQFEAQTPSKTIAARVIGNSTVASAKAVFIDRGSTSGLEDGMAVVTPEGIVGKVVAVYPLVSQVLLITDSTFKVGVESQKGHIHGVLNCGGGKCVVEQIQNEDRVDEGEWFYTSGEDRIFPKGFPVGKVTASQTGPSMREVKINLSGAPGGAEEVLVILQGVHRQIPTTPPAEQVAGADLMPPPAEAGSDAPVESRRQTTADKVLEKYTAFGKEEGHKYGTIGQPVPNFNIKTAAVAKGSEQHDGGTVPAPKPSSVAPSGPPPLLGARPGQTSTGTSNTGLTRQAAASAPKASAGANAPVLPLGAPHRKTEAQPTAPAPAAPQ
ncbi:MAG TPA: rod shape-determining protein MreC [Bryobacteraceae bacterium]|nr:rod shape-determining protein MreC [Bryobacteraceae bacterium]